MPAVGLYSCFEGALLQSWLVAVAVACGLFACKYAIAARVCVRQRRESVLLVYRSLVALPFFMLHCGL